MEYGKRVKETYKKAKELGFPYWLKDDIIAFAIKNDLTQCTVEDFFNIYSKEKEINKKEPSKKANIERSSLVSEGNNLDFIGITVLLKGRILYRGSFLYEKTKK